MMRTVAHNKRMIRLRDFLRPSLALPLPMFSCLMISPVLIGFVLSIVLGARRMRA